MRAKLFLLFILAIHVAGQYTFDTKYYTQILDHFDFQSTQPTTFQQKYLINTNFWDSESGPIFFYTGNEGPIELFAQNTGFMWEVAQEFNAVVLFMEHRYYGSSLPFGPVNSYIPSNMKYLTSEQALADYAYFIPWIKTKLGAQNASVVAFGGSYGGMLTAWFRMKYPHVVAGAISASAPILQASDSVSTLIFNQLVTRDFHDANPVCAQSIRRSWDIMNGMTLAQLNQAFGICPPGLTSQSQILSVFFPWVENAWTYMAMADYPYPSSFLGPMPGYPVNYTCQFFQAGQTDAQIIQAVVKSMGVFYNFADQSGSCYNLTTNGPSTLSDPGSWNYMACSEMVLPSGQDGVNDMFYPAPWNITSYSANCAVTEGVTPRPRWLNIHYGGHQAGGVDLSVYSNIVFSNGVLDPWAGGGVTANLSLANNLVAVTYFGAHHLDLRASNPLDPPSVVSARNLHRYYIRQFIGPAKPDAPPLLTNAQVAGLTVLATIVGVIVLSRVHKHFCAPAAQPVHSKPIPGTETSNNTQPMLATPNEHVDVTIAPSAPPTESKSNDIRDDGNIN